MDTLLQTVSTWQVTIVEAGLLHKQFHLQQVIKRKQNNALTTSRSSSTPATEHYGATANSTNINIKIPINSIGSRWGIKRSNIT